MTMTRTVDSDEYRQQAPRDWASTFGDPDPAYVFQDQPGPPAKHSTAAQIGRTVNKRRQKAEQRHQDRQFRALAQEAVEDAALDHAVDLIRVNKMDKLTPEDRARAAAALERRGGSGLTSAESLAAGYLESADWHIV